MSDNLQEAGLLPEWTDGEGKSGVSQRHRGEWRLFRKLFLSPCYGERDLEMAKYAKAVADILKAYQEGERKAWGFDDAGGDAGALEVAWEE